jgi:hypothetical protein
LEMAIDVDPTCNGRRRSRASWKYVQMTISDYATET